VIGFHREGPALACDGVRLEPVAAAHGTPLYVYSAAAIASRFRAIDEAFAGHPHAVHYALKANSTLAILRLLRGLGSNADANSGGEIDVARRAGFAPAQIVFTGVGKTVDELDYAIGLGVRSINVESAGEIDRVDGLARARGVRAKIAIRVNPDVDAGTHPHISTGLRINKFGIPIADVPALCERVRRMAGVEVVGLHAHIGSQITTMTPLTNAARALVDLARTLAGEGTRIEHLDIGGGLGVSYDGSPVPGAREYAGAVLPILRESGLAIVLEPGRHIMAPAGALLTRVVDVKRAGAAAAAHPASGAGERAKRSEPPERSEAAKRRASDGAGESEGRSPSDEDDARYFVVVDAGMTELLRPMMYNAYHRIEPVVQRVAPPIVGDVVGPLCESSDTLGRERRLPCPEVGELYAVLDAGAYGSVMASNYNRRLLPAEVLIEEGEARLIRRRQTLDDVLALEF
jgi:diaminopimelate decarboxylase